MTRVLSRKGSFFVLQRLLLVLYKVPLRFGLSTLNPPISCLDYSSGLVNLDGAA